MLRSIEEEWNDYSAAIFAKMKYPPSDVQVTETKQAFFAGAWMMFCGTRECGEPDMPEQEAMEWMSAREH